MKGPFKVDVIGNVGDNWLIADFGMDQDGKHYILVTDRIHASDLHMVSGGAKEDAERVCALLNEYTAYPSEILADEEFYDDVNEAIARVKKMLDENRRKE